MKITTLSQLPAVAVSHNPAISKRVMLAAGELASITQFAQAVFPPGEVAYSHHHDDMAEVFLIHSGTGQIEIDGVRHAIHAGSCVTVEPGEEHAITNSGAEDLVLTYFGVRL